MSRVAKKPIKLPAGVEFSKKERALLVKGPKGTLDLVLNELVEVKEVEGQLEVKPVTDSKEGWMQAGTARALIQNMVQGVSEGFEKKLQLIGVGYRAQAKGNKISLSVGYSHPVEMEAPKELSIETPSQTEIVLKSSNKQVLGEFAANVRAIRPPEPYKGKGIRYSDEVVLRKEAKKK
jgi:large subunit ribosomal protein L6